MPDNQNVPADQLLAVIRAANLTGAEWDECLTACEAAWEGYPHTIPLLHQRADGLLRVWETQFLPPTRHYAGLDPFLGRLKEQGDADLWMSVTLTDSMSWAVYFSSELSRVEAFVGTGPPERTTESPGFKGH